MDFKSQPEGSVKCGAYAIYNALIWKGLSVDIDDYTTLLWRKLSTNEAGVSGSEINPHIKKIFNADRIKFPDIKTVLQILDRGDGIVLRYKWIVDSAWGTHYTFIFKEGVDILCVNPHRDENGVRAVKIKITHGELSDMLVKQKVGNNQYPWIWGVKK